MAHGKLAVDAQRSVRWTRAGVLDGRPLVLLAHGFGAPSTRPFMARAASGLVERGLAVARFHFPYMQRNVDEGGRRPPDRAPVLLATWRAMIDKALSWEGAGPLVLAGKSMGGRMASMLLAEGRGEPARAALYLGYPLHPPGRTDALRDAHLPDVPVPQLFVSGTRDSLARRDLLQATTTRLGRRAWLYLVEGGDHSLAVKRSDPLAGSGAWLDACAAFVREHA